VRRLSWPFLLYPAHPEYKTTVEHPMGLLEPVIV
jgi:hypothetical protein